MFGFYNRILNIDIGRKSYDVQPISDDLLQASLGGKGLASHLLLQHNPPGVDPLGPDNYLILSTGPAAGTAIWGSCRYGVFSKSPQTGFYSESYSGGTAAEYMARIGYDAIMIHGASDEPLWIEIGDENVVFHSAQKLWGLDTITAGNLVALTLEASRQGKVDYGIDYGRANQGRGQELQPEGGAYPGG